MGPSLASRILLLLFVAGSVAMLGSSRAEACSCARIAPPTDAPGEAAVVFEGIVIDASAPNVMGLLVDGKVRLQVLRAWKGVKVDTLVLLQPEGCWLPFDVGSTWIVFASQEGSALKTNLCMGSRPSTWPNYAEYLAALGQAKMTGTIAPGNVDAGPPPWPVDAGAAPEAGTDAAGTVDAGPLPSTPDAGVTQEAGKDAPEEKGASSGGGCAVAGEGSSRGAYLTALAFFALAVRSRRRRRH
jgi:MYXO-CTERM domain-containing protein